MISQTRKGELWRTRQDYSVNFRLAILPCFPVICSSMGKFGDMSLEWLAHFILSATLGPRLSCDLLQMKLGSTAAEMLTRSHHHCSSVLDGAPQQSIHGARTLARATSGVSASQRLRKLGIWPSRDMAGRAGQLGPRHPCIHAVMFGPVDCFGPSGVKNIQRRGCGA